MTSGAILSRTPSLGLAKLRFNFPNWGDEHNRNMELIDAALLSIGVAFDGAWDNDTSYPIGAKIIDPDDATFWRALVAHTSPNSGTFSEARAAEPTYWEEIINVINFRGEWADATAYQLNDIVFSGYKWAIVVVTHTSATSFATGVADGNLEIFFDGTTTVTDAEAAATAAGTSETNASTYAFNAGNSASAAAQSVIDAANEVAAALIHRNKAEQWAEEAEDVAVETGQFSAKHHRIKAAGHESEAKDARDEAVNRLENAAGAVRHDIVQTLTSGEQQQARENIGAIGNLLATVVIPYDATVPSFASSWLTKNSASSFTLDRDALIAATGATKVRAHVYGGGGGGGGSNNTDYRGGEGGDGGGYAAKEIPIGDLLATEALTIGARGDGGSASIDNATAGGTTSFGSHVSATGGARGVLGGGNFAIKSSPAPGEGIGGDVNLAGRIGGPAANISNAATGAYAAHGVSVGGNAPGPFGGFGGEYPGNGSPGRNGKGFGGGGSGGTRTSSNNSGGDGAPGGIILEIYG